MSDPACHACADIIATSFPFCYTKLPNGVTVYAINREGCGRTPDPMPIHGCPTCGMALPEVPKDIAKTVPTVSARSDTARD